MGWAAFIPAVVSAAAAVGSTIVQANSAKSQATMQAASLQAQERQTQAAAEKERQALAKANEKTADSNAILRQIQDDNLSGGATLLTSAQGIGEDDLQLGRGNRLG